MTSGGIRLPAPEVAACILDSYATRLGTPLLEPSGDPETDAHNLMELDAVVLSHDGAADPCFVYANRAAASLWRMPLKELVGMPSRLSAPPEQRTDRSQMLSEAARAGCLRGYEGERVAKDGTRFLIRNATLWTVDGYPERPGQAVVFTDWEFLAARD